MKKLTTKVKFKTDDDIQCRVLESADTRVVRLEISSDVPMDEKTMAGTFIEIALKICPEIEFVEEEFGGEYH